MKTKKYFLGKPAASKGGHWHEAPHRSYAITALAPLIFLVCACFSLQQDNTHTCVAWLISGLSASVAIYCVFSFRQQLICRCGEVGFILLACYQVFNAAVPILWLVASTPPINAGAEKFLLGISGYYGVDLNVYDRVSAIYLIQNFVSMLLAALVPPKKGNAMRAPGVLHQTGSLFDSWRMSARRVAPVVTVLLVLAVGFYFQSRGWHLLLVADLGRLELWQTDRLGLLTAIPVLRYIPAVLGILAIIASAAERRTLLLLLTTVLASLPYIAEASRVFPLIIGVAGAVLIITRSGMARLITVAVVIPVFLISNAMPLVTRSSPQLGVVAAFSAFSQEGILGIYQIEIVRSFSGIGQGYGNLAEVLSIGRESFLGGTGVPVGYKAISLSPLPSIVDGFSGYWRSYQTRFHLGNHTPIAFLAEWYLWWGWMGAVIAPLFVCASVFATRSLALAGQRRWHIALAVAGVILFAMFVIRSGAYDIRSATRYLYAALYIFAIMGVVLRSRAPQNPGGQSAMSMGAVCQTRSSVRNSDGSRDCMARAAPVKRGASL